uniref:Uncharacterized protein n=1 Tax=Elphidium margaritaceum TaxID=933848 RepID=A0A7S0TE53_9EUKA|mmetsp:Transcript_208/g.323  ORF Transcript_208/g.323 Transcript_208/m.323 type:complete len:217 (+) Transcript_208:47-697(+)|eukprot:CAMPEP_0202713920 /NCGR_PEP_ID=MMETSP1385-20130828/61456_1 /ASSEMBLY_ACC=CAM_ASM_000861 /TAXON_ID=933848 /ORGANISM="Elphidium margaritaceum" /LENGTH=216 /DNA_ID=CAMNT_0049374465 /DNA_START=46 /DNA_END=696 /DNA_ORIENTATION=-
MDDVASLHYDESPKAQYLRYLIWFIVGVFVITVTIVALDKGFKSGQHGHAFLGIALLLFALTTFYLQYKIVMGDLQDVARIPVYLQLVLTVFLGIAILIVVYSNWHSPEFDCYYDSPGTFVRSTGSPQCWRPPSCFHSSTNCLFYLPQTSGASSTDICSSVSSKTNDTTKTTEYTCSYTLQAPTTTSSTSSTTAKPLESMHMHDDIHADVDINDIY